MGEHICHIVSESGGGQAGIGVGKQLWQNGHAQFVGHLQQAVHLSIEGLLARAEGAHVERYAHAVVGCGAAAHSVESLEGTGHVGVGKAACSVTVHPSVGFPACPPALLVLVAVHQRREAVGLDSIAGQTGIRHPVDVVGGHLGGESRATQLEDRLVVLFHEGCEKSVGSS